jgi:hypothetical protein
MTTVAQIWDQNTGKSTVKLDFLIKKKIKYPKHNNITKQYTCSEAAQQLHHTSHPTYYHSERHTEASRVNALLKSTLTELPPGQKTSTRTLQDPPTVPQ